MFYSESSPDGGIFGNTIPGFPIQDDARSIKTSTGSLHRSGSVSKVIRRIRGEGALAIPQARPASLTRVFAKVSPEIIGWMTKTVKNVTIARVFLRLGDENITAESVVQYKFVCGASL